MTNYIRTRNAATHARLSAEFEAACDRLKDFDYDILSLNNFPSEDDLHRAQHQRSIWGSLLIILCAFLVLGLLGFLPAWIAGIAGTGVFVLIISYNHGTIPGIPGANNHARLHEERSRQYQILSRYIQRIEGNKGYIHLLRPLRELNPSMEDPSYTKLCSLSQAGKLSKSVRSLDSLRSYHLFLVEAHKANQIRKSLEQDSRH